MRRFCRYAELFNSLIAAPRGAGGSRQAFVHEEADPFTGQLLRILHTVHGYDPHAPVRRREAVARRHSLCTWDSPLRLHARCWPIAKGGRRVRSEAHATSGDKHDCLVIWGTGLARRAFAPVPTREADSTLLNADALRKCFPHNSVQVVYVCDLKHPALPLRCSLGPTTPRSHARRQNFRQIRRSYKSHRRSPARTTRTFCRLEEDGERRSNAITLFVVQPGERNSTDQRLEYTLWETTAYAWNGAH